MLYAWKIRVLKNPKISWLWRYWMGRKARNVGSYGALPEYIKKYAPGKSFVDIGCMWGVDGEYAFLAESVGATRALGVDVFGPTQAFKKKHNDRGSSVEFILGDATDREIIARIGTVDVVFCAGVLYHHPSPFELLAALRRICSQTLILRTACIPEIRALPNAAVFFPLLSEKDRQLWNLRSLGVGEQKAITNPYSAADGYGNWFWGLSPSCIRSLLATAGFEVEQEAIEPFARTFVCKAGETPPFLRRLHNEESGPERGVSRNPSL